jgi:transposase
MQGAASAFLPFRRALPRRFLKASRCFDAFHVSKLVHDALEAVGGETGARSQRYPLGGR